MQYHLQIWWWWCHQDSIYNQISTKNKKAHLNTQTYLAIWCQPVSVKYPRSHVSRMETCVDQASYNSIPNGWPSYCHSECTTCYWKKPMLSLAQQNSLKNLTKLYWSKCLHLSLFTMEVPFFTRMDTFSRYGFAFSVHRALTSSTIRVLADYLFKQHGRIQNNLRPRNWK